MFKMLVSNFRSRFPGGRPIHQGESLSNQFPVRTPPLLERYTIPVQQNIGKPPQVVVTPGTKVAKGQLIAKADGFVSANLHAPTSGTIEGIIEIPGATGPQIPALVLVPDGEDKMDSGLAPIENWLDVDPKMLLQRVADAGLVGMGGASFPTHVKLSPPPDKKIDTLIINAAECEPYLTADERLMLEESPSIAKGIAMFARILGVRNVVVGVEDNKMEALSKLKGECALYGTCVESLPVRYPQGSEKQLIYALTHRKVPAGGLPMEAGVVVQNVGTAFAFAEAVLLGKPLIERVVTVTGEPLVDPGNWRHRIGTPISQALMLARGIKEPVAKVIMGGPMMGFAQRSLDTAICKNSSGVLLLNHYIAEQYLSNPCIRCGRCVDGCVMNLLCSTISSAVECGDFEMAEKLHVMDCLECGCCAYMCPAHRPLVQHMRRGKSEIIAKRRKAVAEQK